MTFPTREFVESNADEIVVLLRADDGTPAHIAILDEAGVNVAHEVSRDLAIALAYKLLDYALELNDNSHELEQTSKWLRRNDKA